jgi:hypothetical protein
VPELTGLHLTGAEHNTLRRSPTEARAARPVTVADEHDHYHALVPLSAIVEMVLGDAVERAQR